jgi:FkbM family methyltransferase
MKKNVFIDAGAHGGDSFEYYNNEKRFPIEHFDYYLIELNEKCIKEIQKKIDILDEKHKEKVFVINKALYTHDSEIKLYGSGLEDLEEMPVGLSIKQDHNTCWYDPIEIGTVNCLSITTLLNDLSQEYENIYIKMDIESSEYDVLEKMLGTDDEDGVNCDKIEEIYVEWHVPYIKKEIAPLYKKRKKDIIRRMKNEGLLPNQADTLHWHGDLGWEEISDDFRWETFSRASNTKGFSVYGDFDK